MVSISLSKFTGTKEHILDIGFSFKYDNTHAFLLVSIYVVIDNVGRRIYYDNQNLKSLVI